MEKTNGHTGAENKTLNENTEAKEMINKSPSFTLGVFHA